MRIAQRCTTRPCAGAWVGVYAARPLTMRAPATGRVTLPVRSLRPETVTEDWYPLIASRENSSDAEGSIRLRIKYTDDIVYPIAEYDLMLTTIFGGNAAVVTLLAHTIPAADRDDMAASCLYLANYRSCLLPWLVTLCKADINVAAGPSVLFRSNSFATRSVDVFMRLLGSKFLVDTLAARVRMIYDSKASCEVDPSRVPQGVDIRQNWRRLQIHTTNVWQAVLLAIERVPPPIRALLHEIQLAVVDKFGKDSPVRYICVSSFFFLRFLCPALLSPHTFDITTSPPDATTSRTLTLVVKTLQQLANLTEFGTKEAVRALDAVLARAGVGHVDW